MSNRLGGRLSNRLGNRLGGRLSASLRSGAFELPVFQSIFVFEYTAAGLLIIRALNLAIF